MKNVTKILCLFVMILAMACTKEGPQGPAGANGNANVQYSDWITSSTWTGSSGSYVFDVTDTKITQPILDQGVVLAFAKLVADGANIRPLPTTISSVSWTFIVTLGAIHFTSSLSTTPASTNQFRYIIIPTTTHLRLKKPLNQMTYDEVCELYNIPK